MKFAISTGLLLIVAAPAALAQHQDHAQHMTTQTQPQSGAEQTQDHSTHAGHAMPQLAPRPAPSSSPPPLPAPTAEERAAAFPDMHGMSMQEHMDEDPFIATLLFDRLEWQRADDGEGLGWELQGWAGDLDNRLWLRSEGERRDGAIEHGDVELLWGRPTGPWWDRVLGLRHDLGQGPDRDWLAMGVQGLAPYKFEVAATAYVGANGRAAVRAEAEYELLLTNRLALQPRAEVNLYSKDDPERGIGKGLSDMALGLRLRYQLHRQFAPYVGYEWSRKFGRTAALVEQTGGDRSEGVWVAGIRFWF